MTSAFKQYFDNLDVLRFTSSTCDQLKIPKYIRPEDYFGRMDPYKFKSEVRVNAFILLERVNKFLFLFYKWLELDRPLVIWSTGVSSGIRTPASNTEIYRVINARKKAAWDKLPDPKAPFKETPEATKSTHLNGQGIDLSDRLDLLKQFVQLFPKVLDLLDLFYERFEYTDTWLHLQSVAFNSYVRGGTRGFKPF